MNVAICDRYDTDVARTNELLDTNIKKFMLNHALLEVDTFTSTDETICNDLRFVYTWIYLYNLNWKHIKLTRITTYKWRSSYEL